MDIDIGFWLTLALAATVAVWLIDKVFKLKQKGGRVEGAVETSNSLISVFFVVLVIRSFIVEPFTIPSGSMLPTLQVNDFILVNKFAYGLRLPVTNTRIIETGEPQRREDVIADGMLPDGGIDADRNSERPGEYHREAGQGDRGPDPVADQLLDGSLPGRRAAEVLVRVA